MTLTRYKWLWLFLLLLGVYLTFSASCVLSPIKGPTKDLTGLEVSNMFFLKGSFMYRVPCKGKFIKKGFDCEVGEKTAEIKLPETEVTYCFSPKSFSKLDSYVKYLRDRQ